MPLESADLEAIRAAAAEQLRRAGIAIASREQDSMDVADFQLGRFPEVGLVELVYVNTERYAAKELVLLPHQTCPEHWHPPVGNDPGKQESFRCRAGEVFLYVEGEATAHPACQPPIDDDAHYTVWHELHLRPADQHTIEPGVRHWFQAGADGAVVSEFSSPSRDETDRFTDPRITWQPQ